ncbi:hypothetical protein J1N35_044019 [Gossypium stocksii]|uniref:RNase H type-1 domain-containing protein n=1 Tax=Gossypium stocksii TaxID=47602 RepID=A0A9D3U8J9_9ROSI|nr:hypothetical protein J1N35_044019 [Gossypium stocksii]
MGLLTQVVGRNELGFKGLRLAWSISFERVLVKVDNSTIVSLLSSKFACDSDIVSAISQLCHQDWVACFRHIWREVNLVADGMAKLDCGMDHSLQVFNMPVSCRGVRTVATLV